MNDVIYRQQAIDAIKTWGLIDGLSEGQAIEILADEEKLPSAQQDLTCSECLYFEQDHFEIVSGVPLIVAHDICMKWGGGCKTDPQGYCFMGVKK